MCCFISLRGRPITKKNSSRIVHIGQHAQLLPSKAYAQYEKDCLKQTVLTESLYLVMHLSYTTLRTARIV